MKPISVHVAEDEYQAFKALAARRGKPVASLLREAMHRYLVEELREGTSLLDIPAHQSGALTGPWERHEILDEMRGR